MCLDDLKTTLQMEMLRIRSPEMAQKEVYARLIGHNLIVAPWSCRRRAYRRAGADRL